MDDLRATQNRSEHLGKISGFEWSQIRNTGSAKSTVNTSLARLFSPAGTQLGFSRRMLRKKWVIGGVMNTCNGWIRG